MSQFGACSMPLIEASNNAEASNKPVSMTDEEAEQLWAALKEFKKRKDEKKQKKKRKEEAEPEPEEQHSLEFQYLYCQGELCRMGIPLEIQTHHVYKEGDSRRMPYPTDLYFDEQFNEWAKDPSRTKEEIEERRKERMKPEPNPKTISDDELNKLLEKLPPVLEGQQSVFLPGPEKYEGNELEYRLLGIKGWLEAEGIGTGCGIIRPQMEVDKETAISMGIAPLLQFVHDAYPRLKPSIKYPFLINFTEEPQHAYQSALTSYNLSHHLEKQEKKENKEKKPKKRSRTLRVARTLASGVAGCITM